MPRLVRAYLAWKHGLIDCDGDSEDSGEDPDSQSMHGAPADDSDSIFHVTAIGITGKPSTR